MTAANYQTKLNAILKKAVQHNELCNFWHNEFVTTGENKCLDMASEHFEIANAYLDCWQIMNDIELEPCALDKLSLEDFEACDSYNERNGIAI